MARGSITRVLVALVACASTPTASTPAAPLHWHGGLAGRLRGGTDAASPRLHCTVECNAWGEHSRRKWTGTPARVPGHALRHAAAAARFAHW